MNLRSIPLPSRRRAGMAAVAFVLTCMVGLVQAQQQVAPVAEPVAVPGRQNQATLQQLGIDYEMTLRGTQGSAGVPFAVRNDQVVNQARLHLRYSYSPALLPDLSHLRVSVNDVTVATLSTPPEDAGRLLERDVEIDPRLITGYNRINLQLIGHYARECEDPDHTSLWANIDTSSYLELGWTPLQLTDDLSLLPVPFFDPRDTRRLELPFVFTDTPAAETLQVAGIVSSWFGALAGYRGALFPALTGTLPLQGNAVVVVTSRNPVADVPLPEIAGPTVAVTVNPNDPDGKLLLVLGRDEAELRIAATALALGSPLSGDVALIRDLAEAAPRVPYDAPNWISSARPVRFSDLVEQASELSVTGYNPDLIRVRLQLPPDLFVWNKPGIPVDLRYRYTLPDGADKSALNVSINDAFVTTLPLNGWPRVSSTVGRLLQRLKVPGQMPIRQKLVLPTGPFSASSQLRFHFFFERPQVEACKNTFPDVSAAIDGDSVIDLSGFHHFMAMPNLAAFGNAGFPFTRLADLSETAVVLPVEPGNADIGNVLTLLGRMGASTGYPALRTQIISPDQVERHADRDLLVVGSRASQPLFGQWQASMPVSDSPDARRFHLSDWVYARLPAFLSPSARRTDLPTVAEVALKPEADDVLLMGFESPLAKGRSVVALLSEDPAQVSRLFDAWFDPARLRNFQGSVILLHEDKVRSLAGNQTYYVGHLPLPSWLRWYFSDHPVLLALGTALFCLLLALILRWLLRLRSVRRLQETK